MPELKPCCGHKPHHIRCIDEDLPPDKEEANCIICEHCGDSSDWFDTEAEAIDAWNQGKGEKL